MFNSSCFFFSLQTVNRISEQLEPLYRLVGVLIFPGIIFYIVSTSLNKQLTFLDATTGFPSHKRRSKKQAQKLHTEDVSYLIWLVTRYQSGISVLLWGNQWSSCHKMLVVFSGYTSHVSMGSRTCKYNTMNTSMWTTVC